MLRRNGGPKGRPSERQRPRIIFIRFLENRNAPLPKSLAPLLQSLLKSAERWKALIFFLVQVIIQYSQGICPCIKYPPIIRRLQAAVTLETGCRRCVRRSICFRLRQKQNNTITSIVVRSKILSSHGIYAEHAVLMIIKRVHIAPVPIHKGISTNGAISYSAESRSRSEEKYPSDPGKRDSGEARFQNRGGHHIDVFG